MISILPNPRFRLAPFAICLATLALAATLHAEPAAIDLSRAAVLAPARKIGPEAKAVQMLVEEVEKRSRIRWNSVNAWPAKDTPVVLLGRAEDVREMVRGRDFVLADDLGKGGAEGYRIAIQTTKDGLLVLIVGNDARGVIFGVGRLLRELRMERDRITLPAAFHADSAPRTPLRGHQLGYRPKTNSYDGWTVAMWEQYIRDLVVFGCNAIELIPPRSDDARDSPHFPLPPMRMMVEMSRLADAYGLDVWVWYPAMDSDYGNPRTVEFALKEWAEVLKALPRLDAIFVPGGDPGHTSPKLLFALLEKQTANVRRFHPKCQMWVSPQGFSKAETDEFLALLAPETPWLTGVVHGPQVRMSLPAFRKAVPARYPIRDYPDITHSRHCQYPVPDWDVAFALTEGREGSNPRPNAMAGIVRLYRPHTIGFITYSEGCHDDVNKCIWSALGWDERTDVREILREYSRYFIGPGFEESFSSGLMQLEKNWVGPVLKNVAIAETSNDFRAMEKAARPPVKQNWRFQQAVYRAYYDGYVRARLTYEMGLETAALDRLRDKKLGTLQAMSEAEAILDKAVKEPVAAELRARVFELAEALFQSIHAQLSVGRYQAIAIERGANLDGIDIPLNSAAWLKQNFKSIRGVSDEAERRSRIDALLNRTYPGRDGFYDSLGDPTRRPHLIRGDGPATDPAFYASSLTGFGFRGRGPDASLPREWWTHAESLYDAPLKMRYSGLDKTAAYQIRVAYGRERLGGKIRLVANDGTELHGSIGDPLKPVVFDIPAAATAGGELTLTWTQPPGTGGTGRGCQVAEVFLMKKR